MVVSAVGHQAPVCGLPPRASRQSHAPTLLLSWATKVGWCLGHFSSHLNRRRWEGRKEESRTIKAQVQNTVLLSKQLEVSKNDSVTFLPNWAHVSTHLISCAFLDILHAQKCFLLSFTMYPHGYPPTRFFFVLLLADSPSVPITKGVPPDLPALPVPTPTTIQHHLHTQYTTELS